MSNPYAPPEDRRRPADDDTAAPPQGSSPAGPPPQAAAQAGPPSAPQWYPPQQLGQPGPQGQHGQPGQPGHDPRLGQPQQRPEPVPTDPEGAERARKLARNFGIFLLAGVVLSTIRAPWQAVALPFVVVAIVYAIRALVAAARAHVRGALVPMLAGGIAIAAFWAFVTITMLALWPLQSDREECLAGALTVTATAECNQTFEDGLEDWRKSLTTRTGS
ncbi:hypothetical protein [Cellulomonas rhizosphaerae]|uniref:Uncharacterized protein n=1 Tax=Cellulomonas rhizosphaerae TaxID=2293719 RepID=A0A413RR29_9CELL|nr:hypothetical protein [Cellulomonas rhizosphaerae]RHA44393.1 hypothetical protein D1825_01480 [Cellulomonas rhizosphaerae]